MRLNNLAQLAALALQRPTEVWDRLATKLESIMDERSAHPVSTNPQHFESLLEKLGETLGKDCKDYSEESALRTLEAEIRAAEQSLPEHAPFARIHSADILLARACYVVCRAVRPAIVLETGVAYGVTTAFILQALELNGRGQLHSVDLPPLGKDGDQFVGALVQEELRHRWQLHRGTTKRVLPVLIPKLGGVDVFIHDSLHTYRTMLREFQSVEPFLSDGSIVIADDVDRNFAFSEWSLKRPSRLVATVAETEKHGHFGLSVG